MVSSCPPAGKRSVAPLRLCVVQLPALLLRTSPFSVPSRSSVRTPRSKSMPGHNMLGLEIRAPIIERANKWAASLDLTGTVLFLRWVRPRPPSLAAPSSGFP